MIKLGVNSVLFDGFDLQTAVEHIAMAGYDGIEISAISGMCEHLELGRWREQVPEIKSLVSDHGLELLSIEHARLDRERLPHAFEAAAELGVPVVNVGPGGKSNENGSLAASIEELADMAELAEQFNLTLCVKSHVGQAIYNTPTTLEAMKQIDSKAFGIDMDPSHVFRAGENPEDSLKQVIGRVHHVHIRDCKGRQTGPGDPPNQACGRGDIDLMAYCRSMVEGNYDGPACLEVIGAAKAGLSLSQVVTIAAESYGYLNSCLRHLGAR